MVGALVAVVLYWLWNGPGGVAEPAHASLRAFDIERLPDDSWPPIEESESAFSLSFSAGSRSTKTNHTTTRSA